MAARSSAATDPAERELVITRIFDAPRHLVFKAWTEPEHFRRWWGPKGFTNPVCEMDVRPGGAYRFCTRSPEGRDYWVHGVYREIVEPERLVFTYAVQDVAGKPGHQMLVTVSFSDHDGKTRLTMHQALFETVADRDDHVRGWNEVLDHLVEYLAAA
jgi:uncharacterized protein YndB with AHSA1/START domain